MMSLLLIVEWVWLEPSWMKSTFVKIPMLSFSHQNLWHFNSNAYNYIGKSSVWMWAGGRTCQKGRCSNGHAYKHSLSCKAGNKRADITKTNTDLICTCCCVWRAALAYYATTLSTVTCHTSPTSHAYTYTHTQVTSCTPWTSWCPCWRRTGRTSSACTSSLPWASRTASTKMLSWRTLPLPPQVSCHSCGTEIHTCVRQADVKVQ